MLRKRVEDSAKEKVEDSAKKRVEDSAKEKGRGQESVKCNLVKEHKSVC